jgi:FkbM family methyltransferase
MGLISSYLDWHKNRFNALVRHQFSGEKRRLTLFYNCHAKWTGIPERLNYNKIDNTYFLSGLGKTRYFVSSRFAKWGYWNGVEAKGNVIGNAYFLNEISFSDGDVVVDCGAYNGDLKQYFINLGVDIEYIGFEPSVADFNCLKKNVSPSAVFNIGLWKQKAELDFFCSTLGADSSFIQPKTYTDIQKIKVDRLDNLITSKIKLLKVEAEGCEPEVIMGCENIFQNIDYIAADLGFERGVLEENTFPAFINILLNNGFEVVSAIAPSGRNTILFKNSKLE